MSVRTSFRFVATLTLAAGLYLPGSLFAQESSTQKVATVPSQLLSEHVTSQSKATYPAMARSAHVTGTVVVSVQLDSDGNVTQISPVSGPSMLRQAAADAVRQWGFSPVEVDGKPAAVRSTVQVSFSHPSSGASD